MHTTRRPLRSRWLTILLPLAFAACQRAPQAELKDIKVPPGFTFANSRSVKVAITVSADKLPASGTGRLEIARADGKLLFQGIAHAQRPFSMELGAPLKDAQLIATLYGSSSTPTRLALPIVDGTATGSF